LDYGFLVPIREIFSAELLRQKTVRWVLVFGLLPLVIWNLARIMELSFTQVVWLIEIYFCLFWALYFYGIIAPGTTIWRRALAYASFTVVVGIPVLLVVQRLPLIGGLYTGTESTGLIARLFANVVGVGLLEETCKALPLLLFGMRGRVPLGVRDGVFLGMMSGLGFAAAEGVAYTTLATGALAINPSADTATVQVLMLFYRAVTGPILHASWAGIVGWFIGAASVRQGKRWPVVVVGIALMATLHGAYNTLSDGPLHLLIAGVTLVAFMAYLAHGQSEPSIQSTGGSDLESAAQPE
jgi:RsiW-degrading membrane proteinase PrsW (M82 family)